MYVAMAMRVYIVEVRNGKNTKYIAISEGDVDEQDFDKMGMLTDKAKEKFGLDPQEDIAEAVGLEIFEMAIAGLRIEKIDPKECMAVDTNGLWWRYDKRSSHWEESK
ncbi:MAG TPA: hypothetical protein ENF81_08365 [Thermotogaceae bacterium]|nr:hypothetical protein [Thermotogaceae bacterium]